jgi:hypothetical protein
VLTTLLCDLLLHCHCYNVLSEMTVGPLLIRLLQELAPDNFMHAVDSALLGNALYEVIGYYYYSAHVTANATLHAAVLY